MGVWATGCEPCLRLDDFGRIRPKLFINVFYVRLINLYDIRRLLRAASFTDGPITQHRSSTNTTRSCVLLLTRSSKFDRAFPYFPATVWSAADASLAKACGRRFSREIRFAHWGRIKLACVIEHLVRVRSEQRCGLLQNLPWGRGATITTCSVALMTSCALIG